MKVDCLIIGGGLAGWRAAEAAVETGACVRLVCNGAGNSPHIHALNVPVLPEDSVALYMNDTLHSGHGTNDVELVRVLCEGAVKLKDEFQFDREGDGSYKLLKPLGSTVARCVMMGRSVGAELLSRLKNKLAGRVEVVEGTVESLDFSAAKSIVLATGGWCGGYGFSTNPPYLKGDGIRMAEALGAAVVDRGNVQFEPTVALSPAALRGIPVITTMLNEGATFRNRDGVEFLQEKALNKDLLSKAIFAEIAKGNGVEGGVWYDATNLPANLWETRYQPVLKRYADHGIDLRKEWMLVAPAPHTSLGGLKIDASCRVLRESGEPIPGLFAAGEVTGGLHGDNRLGGNAGTEVLVFGRIAGLSAGNYALKNQ